jgi:hypothetical protein
MSEIKESEDRHASFVEEENGNFDRSWRDEQWGEKTLNAETQEVYFDEKELGPAEAIRAFPKAVMWSLVMATCVIMEVYDTNLLGNFFAYRMCTKPYSDYFRSLITKF